MFPDDIEIEPQRNWRGGRTRIKLPFYRRAWFGVLMALFVVLALVGFGAFTFTMNPLREKANGFDLQELNKLEAASIIYDRNGEELSRLYMLNRTPVAFKEVPQHLVDALVTQEDSRFFSHNGVDYTGIARAMYHNFKAGEETQGASTITQQLARNTFNLTERSYKRKLLEALTAMRIEENFSKSQILELYLNRIYFGGGFYGIQAASLGYFGKDVGEINIQEAATLCGLIKSPNNIQPLRHPERALKERNAVLERMVKEGYLSRDQGIKLRASPLITAPKEADPRLSYVFDEVRRVMVDKVGEERAAVGGFQIYTTIDKNLQKAAEDALRKRLLEVEQQEGYAHQTYAQFKTISGDYRRKMKDGLISPEEPRPVVEYLQGSSISIDNATGAILAMVGGRDFIDSMYNRALYTRRPVGTAFIPFVYAAAFSAPDLFPGTQVEDAPIDNRRVMIGGLTGILGEWGTEAPEAETRWKMSLISLRESLVNSRNAATVRLGDMIGNSLAQGFSQDERTRAIPWMLALDSLKDLSAKAGIASPLKEFPASFLGVSEMELDELCLAYSTFPNGGLRAKRLHLVERITDAEDNLVFEIPESERGLIPAMDPIAAYQTHTCLDAALHEGTGRNAVEMFGLGDFPAAGKSGTHYEFKDLWFFGYTSSVTCGVWVGFDKQKTLFNGAFSNRIALPIWVDTMNAAASRFEANPIEPPPEAERIEICQRSGQRATDFCFDLITRKDGRDQSVRTTYVEYLRPGTRFESYCTEHTGEGLAHDLKAFSRIGIGGGRGSDAGMADTGRFAHVESVPMQGLTIIGSDPYNAIQPTLRAVPINDDGTQARKAEVVEPLDDVKEELPLRLTPPPRLFIEGDKPDRAG